MESFEELRQFEAAYYPANALSSFLLDNIEESITDYLDLSAVEGANAWLRFIPVPDASKKGKSIWMLPNLTSFTNIYARINLYRGGDLSKVEIFHDEQAHFDEILKLNKSLLEKTDMRDAIVIDTANYTFTQSASLMFSKSHEHGGLRIVDLLAGMVMRYVQETMEGKKRSPDIIAAYDSILRMSNQYQGLGINLVVTNELHRELHF